MAGSMKDIKLRIKSVESTMQITKAMELVASSKMRRAKERVEHSRPYFETLHETLTKIAAADPRARNPYLRRDEVKRTLLIVIAATAALPVDTIPTCSSRPGPKKAKCWCCPSASARQSISSTTRCPCSRRRCCWRQMSRWASASSCPARSRKDISRASTMR